MNDILAYFLLALKEGLVYRKVNWVINMFATTEYEENWKENVYPYKLVKTPEQVYYVDPSNLEQLIPIGNSKGNFALLTKDIGVLINPNNVFNAKEEIETTVGNVLVNYILYHDAFGDKIPFQTGKITGRSISGILKDKLVDDPSEGEEKDPTQIYVSDFLTYYKGYNYLLNFTQLSIPGDTEKSLQTHPDMAKLRNELFEKHKHELSDPAVVTRIEEQLEALDREWLEGDSSLGLYRRPKDFKVIRKKLYYTYGNVTAFNETEGVNLIDKPLEEGWDLSKFKHYNNDSRAGSYDRGAETALGGELTKWILRASNNIQLKEEDCGSVLGDRVLITEKNAKNYLGFYYLNRNAKATRFDESKISSYLGKRMIIRSPRYCQTSNGNHCKVCVGDTLSHHEAGVSSALSKVGSDLMAIAMSSMHGKVASVAKYDFNEQLT